MIKDLPTLLTITRVAEVAGVSRDLVTRMIARGLLAPVAHYDRGNNSEPAILFSDDAPLRVRATVGPADDEL